jgi:putative hemolysin
MFYVEALIVLALILLNGFFACSELAVLSSRKARLKTLARAGVPGARAALDLAETPGTFLPTVQIGITLTGVLASAFSGATLASKLAPGWRSFRRSPRGATASPLRSSLQRSPICR